MIEGLLGWLGAFVLTTAAAVFSGPRPARATLLGAAAMTAFPGAWAATTLIGPAVLGGSNVGAAVVGVVVHGGLFALVGVLAAALQDEAEPVLRPSKGQPSEPEPDAGSSVVAPSPEPRSEPVPSRRPSRPRPKSSLPSIRPAGAVAAGAARGGGGGGSGAEVERDGLLRILAQGPDFQTSAAAKALAVDWEGTRDRRTLDGLIAVVRRDDIAGPARAEVWIAIRQVAGAFLSGDEETAVRASFPEGLDEEWLDALEAELHASG